MAIFDLHERGYFWWADDPIQEGNFAPDGAIAGEIQVGTNGATKLILDGVLPRGKGRPNLSLGAIPTGEQELAVVGRIKKGQAYVRLEQLSDAGFSFGQAHGRSESLKARLCVQGSNLISDLPPNRYCTSVRLSLAGFEEWLQLQPPKLEDGKNALTARMAQYSERIFEIDEATISIGVAVNCKSDNILAEIVIRQEGYMTYTPKLPTTLDEVVDLTRKLEDLLVLLTDCERTLGFPQVKVGGDDNWNQVNYETLRRPQKEISRTDLWTTFPSLLPCFGEIANAWITKSAKVGPGFHLYLGNRRGMPLYVEHRFVNLVWGLEAFHRRSSGKPRNRSLAEKIERILNAVTTRDRKWLKRMLEHAHEPNLAQRIFEVLAPLPLGFNKDKLRNFAERCATERNLISHFGGRGDKNSYEKQVSIWALLSYALDPLYHARILQEIGLPETALRQIFLSSFPAARIRDVLAKNGLSMSDREIATE